jgi:hypothetical protein
MLIKHKYHHFYLQLLLLLFSDFSYLIPVFIGVANAQETVESANPTSETPIAQAEPSQPTRRRLKNPFFEEERKLRFGYGGFLENALDGADNFFAADSITNLSNATLNELSNPIAQNIDGLLSVGPRDKNNPNFLNITFVPTNSSIDSLNFKMPRYGSDPRIGTITVTGKIGTLNFIGDRRYSGSFSINNISVNNARVSGAVQLVDPNNPGASILIQLPPTVIQNYDDNTTITKPAVLSIGLPTDR